MGRCDVYDPAPAGLDHDGYCRSHGVKGRRQVDGDNIVPLIHWKGLDRRDMLDTGIVDQDIKLAEALDSLPDHGLNLLRFAHICI